MQFPRYAQVLDTDYDNYMVMYQCLETAKYFDKETNEEIDGAEAFNRVKTSQIDFKMPPYAEYKYDDTVDVQPHHVQHVSILWRPKKDQEKVSFGEDAQDAYMMDRFHYQAPNEQTVDELKKFISKTMPDQFSANTLAEEYTMLNHMDGQCEYDPSTLEES